MKQAAPTSEDCARPACDLRAALEQLGGDEPFLREIIALFRQEARRLLGEVRAEVDRGDARGIARAAHALKGSAGYLFAGPTVEAAQRLESIGAGEDLAEAANAFEDLEREFHRLAEALSAAGAQPIP